MVSNTTGEFHLASDQFNEARCGKAFSQAPRIAYCFAGMETRAYGETRTNGKTQNNRTLIMTLTQLIFDASIFMLKRKSFTRYRKTKIYFSPRIHLQKYGHIKTGVIFGQGAWSSG